MCHNSLNRVLGLHIEAFQIKLLISCINIIISDHEFKDKWMKVF